MAWGARIPEKPRGKIHLPRQSGIYQTGRISTIRKSGQRKSGGLRPLFQDGIWWNTSETATLRLQPPVHPLTPAPRIMAKKSWIARNARKKETVEKYADLRLKLKAEKDRMLAKMASAAEASCSVRFSPPTTLWRAAKTADM